MTTFIINVRSEINNRKIKYYVSRFVNCDYFNRYIQVEVLVYSENEAIKIGNDYYVLDIQNTLEIKSFIFLIQQNFASHTFNEKINKFVFKYTELKRKEYLNLKNKIYS